MASIAEHMSARNDNDLFQRLVAAAEMAGVEAPEQFVGLNRGKLISTPIEVDGQTTTLSAVHAYAVATYQPVPRPGANPAAVTDQHLKEAIKALAPVVRSQVGLEPMAESPLVQE